jgi:hypothetical protein
MYNYTYLVISSTQLETDRFLLQLKCTRSIFQYDELFGKGHFSREDIVTALTVHEGHVDVALQELLRTQGKPFMLKIWGQAEPAAVNSAAPVAPAAAMAQDDDRGQQKLAPQHTAGAGMVN